MYAQLFYQLPDEYLPEVGFHLRELVWIPLLALVSAPCWRVVQAFRVGDERFSCGLTEFGFLPWLSLHHLLPYLHLPLPSLHLPWLYPPPPQLWHHLAYHAPVYLDREINFGVRHQEQVPEIISYLSL